MADGQAEIRQILLRQIWQNLRVNVVCREDLGIAPQIKIFEPLSDVCDQWCTSVSEPGTNCGDCNTTR